MTRYLFQRRLIISPHSRCIQVPILAVVVAGIIVLVRCGLKQFPRGEAAESRTESKLEPTVCSWGCCAVVRNYYLPRVQLCGLWRGTATTGRSVKRYSWDERAWNGMDESRKKPRANQFAKLRFCAMAVRSRDNLASFFTPADHLYPRSNLQAISRNLLVNWRNRFNNDALQLRCARQPRFNRPDLIALLFFISRMERATRLLRETLHLQTKESRSWAARENWRKRDIFDILHAARYSSSEFLGCEIHCYSSRPVPSFFQRTRRNSNICVMCCRAWMTHHVLATQRRLVIRYWRWTFQDKHRETVASKST